MKSLVVDRRDAGQTLAAFLKQSLQVSWSEASKLVELKQVRLNGQICAAIARRLKVGERVELIERKVRKNEVPAAQLGFRRRMKVDVPEGLAIVHSDEDIVVVNKPPRLTTMRHAQEAAEFGRGKKYLPTTAADYLPMLLNDRRAVIAVHRIDRDTSGLVVFARTPAAAEQLGRQFRAHTVKRSYLAICRGIPTESRIESSLVSDRGDGRRGSGPTGDGQRAVTHVQVLRSHGSLSLVECRLETGRTHQVRIHLGELGCPLAGEHIYDRPIHGAPVADPSGATRIALHAASLGFLHPRTGKAVAWQSNLPEDMRALAQRNHLV